jgi:hypothetical protein
MKVAAMDQCTLAYWVALAEMLSPILITTNCVTKEKTISSSPVYDRDRCVGYSFSPQSIWSQGGPLIEKYTVTIYPFIDGQGWYAHALQGRGTRMEGGSPLVAAMRSIVATKWGKEIAERTLPRHALGGRRLTLLSGISE